MDTYIYTQMHTNTRFNEEMDSTLHTVYVLNINMCMNTKKYMHMQMHTFTVILRRADSGGGWMGVSVLALCLMPLWLWLLLMSSNGSPEGF